MSENEHQDMEIIAMQESYNLLKDLEPDAQKRVINWLTGRLNLSGQIKQKIQNNQESFNGDDINSYFSSYKTLADLFAIANVKSDQDKVLLTASYLQVKNNVPELISREINKELENLGHKVGNITNTISSLMFKKPQLMIQTRKEGKTQQAQKKYKVTIEGLTAAKKLIIKNDEISE